MNIQKVIIIFLAVLVSFHSQAEVKKHKEINQVLKTLSDESGLKGTHFVAVVNENGLSFIESYSNENSSFDGDTKFLIASHTKAMTSTLLSILHANQEVDLFSPVSAYDAPILTNEKLDINKITLHQLLTHTAGFTSIQHTFKSSFLGYKNSTELVESLNHKTLVAPNNNFRYSNTGPIVASMYAESVIDKTWQELMESKLLKPLEMSNTTTNIENVDSILPSIITNKDGNIFNRGHYKTNQTMHASGGIVSTVNDLAKWLKANINQEHAVLSKHNVFDLLHTEQAKQNKEYFTYQRSGYSLGWDIAEYNGEMLLTRFGNYAGYSIHVSFMPERKVGVIAFTNQDVAYALPHVIANYAYNTELKKRNKEVLLAQESKRVKTSITKAIFRAPDNSLVVQANDFPSELLGEYQNEQNWPEKHIFVKDGVVKVSWGVLKGTLLHQGEKYTAHFGAIERPITLPSNNEVALKNGSLIYQKK